MEAYIVAGYRSAIGKAKRGGFKNYRTDDLAVDVIKHLSSQVPELDTTKVDDVIVGCANPEGEQGLQVANFAKAFDMRVIAWSHNLKKEDCEKANVEYVSSSDLFKMSDILTIHTKLSERTLGYIDNNNLKLMKKTSVIVNTSRGPIIKENDLIKALNNNIISCAALDVYDQEPLPKDHILRKTKNLILTPHIGYVSEEAYEKFFKGGSLYLGKETKSMTVQKITP